MLLVTAAHVPQVTGAESAEAGKRTPIIPARTRLFEGFMAEKVGFQMNGRVPRWETNGFIRNRPKDQRVPDDNGFQSGKLSLFNGL